MPTAGNPRLTIRMDPEEKARFITEAYNNGTNGAQLCHDFIDWWMGKPGAELPARPARAEAGDA
ncbi:hypothetical protein [Amycolatopsis sp. CFH S0078]|uniref:hypothetical protein n=1 Tax=Amycolatopsis sp. CFH S0078 TaxID=1644108 RepID=UPI00106E0A0F|nr:hypothetical protein [Amycolatopsis sp. CFH S0078]